MKNQVKINFFKCFCGFNKHNLRFGNIIHDIKKPIFFCLFVKNGNNRNLKSFLSIHHYLLIVFLY